MRPLVLVHGFMGGSDQWTPQLSGLGEGRGLVRLDLPGFGRNAHLEPVSSISGFAAWALAELDALNIDKFDLLGHSMGGMIVQEMIRQAPDRIPALVLYGTGAVGVLPGRFEPIETSMTRAVEDGANATARRISATWFLQGEKAEGYEACASIAEQSSLGAILAGLRAMQGWSGVGHLPMIAASTLVIWGDQDRTYAWPQVEELWQKIPNSHLAVLPGCAHAVHLERPEPFNLIVRQFLESEG